MNKYFKDIFRFDLNASCIWLPANQLLFQLANMFLVLTYFVKPSGMVALIQIRVALICAGLCFALWGGIVTCSLDCMVWNLVFAVGNSCHLLYLLNRLKPASFKNKYEESIYETMFKPVDLKPCQLKRLFLVAKQRSLQEGEYYARQDTTESKYISIIVCGQFQVLFNGNHINEIIEYEFLNSPEWLSMSYHESTPKYQVSLVASVDSVIYEWHKEDLLKELQKDKILKNIFDAIVARDICKKLCSFHQTLLLQESKTSSEQGKHVPLLIYSPASLLRPLHNKRQSFISSAVSPGEFRKDITIPSSYSTVTTSVLANNNIIQTHYINLPSHEATDTISQDIPSETTLGRSSIQKNNFDDDFSVSGDFSDRLMYSSKSSSLYREEEEEDDYNVGEENWYQSLDRQILINLKETDL